MVNATAGDTTPTNAAPTHATPTNAAPTNLTASPANATPTSATAVEARPKAFAKKFALFIQRLEVATSRLEALADTSNAPPGPIVAEEPETPLSPALPAEVPKQIVAYDELILDGKFPVFMELSKQIGDDVLTMVETFRALFDDLRDLILEVAYNQEPDTETVKQAVRPLFFAIHAVVRPSNGVPRNGTPFEKHAQAVSESIGVLWWPWKNKPTIEDGQPPSYIRSIIRSVKFVSDRVIDKLKGQPIHQEWVDALHAVLTELEAWAMEYHPTQLTWNAKGGDLSLFITPPEAFRPRFGELASAAPPPAAEPETSPA